MTDIDPRQEWETPADFWKVINGEFAFQMDACATEDNTKVPGCFFTRIDDGLRQAWCYRTYCNPGFKSMAPWLQQARYQAERLGPHGVREGKIVVMMVMGRVNPSTDVWREEGLRASEIRLLSPRVQFIAPPGVKQTSNNQENALFIYRWNPHRRPPDIWTWKWDETPREVTT